MNRFVISRTDWEIVLHTQSLLPVKDYQCRSLSMSQPLVTCKDYQCCNSRGQWRIKNVTAKVPALFVFGDSIVDPGNNNYIPTLAKANFPPYGRDFIDHKPIGHFSNGKLSTYFIGISKIITLTLFVILNSITLIGT